MTPLLDIPAITELAAFGTRFVYWKHVRDKATGKRRKVPFQWDGKDAAKSNDPTTWAALDALLAALPKRRMEGIGVMLGDLGDGRWLVGVDLDLCRSPATGALEPWSRRWIDRLRTYAEVSPSGTGVKLLGTVDRLPAALMNGTEPKGLEASPPEARIPEGAEGGDHEKPEIGVYPWRRFFTLTGQHLDATPDELADITDAFAELAHEVAGMAGTEGADAGPRAVAGAAGPDLDGLPAELREVIEADDKLRSSWATGAKLTKGGNTTRNGLEFSLVYHLASRDQPDELIELAVRHYPHGQVGSGKLTGGNAERRIDRLLAKAEEIREKARKFREAAAWYQELLTAQEGEPRDCLANGGIILRKDPAFAGRIRFDEHREATVCRDVPWRPGGDWREWTDTDDLRLAEWCQLREVPLRPSTCADAVAAVADEHRFHPVRDYLESLAWDGVRRLDTWLETHLGVRTGGGRTEAEREAAARRQAYVRQVARKWPISAVARIYQPGCKADHAVIEEGDQGIGKSSALAALVPNPDWFTDEVSDLGTKDSAQDLRGKWIIELPELSAMKRPEVERTKAFMSRAVDHYRPSYGRRARDFPRQCVFGGTTNADAYFGDETGNRRFWPVKVGAIDLDTLRRDRDQLWAEAVAAYKAGEEWWLARDVEAVAAEEQADRRIIDPWEEHLLDWADSLSGDVTVEAALCQLGVPRERHDQAGANRVARILKAGGWERVRSRVGGTRVYGYRKAERPQSAPVGKDASGDKKASNGAAVPTVPTVPSRSGAIKGPPPTPDDRDGCGWVGGGPSASFSKSGGTTGDTGDTPPAGDEPRWLSRLRVARTPDQRNAVIRAWTEAAGGRPGVRGEVLVSELPPPFLGCTIANLARRYGWDVRGIGR